MLTIGAIVGKASRVGSTTLLATPNLLLLLDKSVHNYPRKHVIREDPWVQREHLLDFHILLFHWSP